MGSIPAKRPHTHPSFWPESTRRSSKWRRLAQDDVFREIIGIRSKKCAWNAPYYGPLSGNSIFAKWVRRFACMMRRKVNIYFLGAKRPLQITFSVLPYDRLHVCLQLWQFSSLGRLARIFWLIFPLGRQLAILGRQLLIFAAQYLRLKPKQRMLSKEISEFELSDD